MNELGLFAGAGGGLLASNHLLGWRTRCAVEIDPYCQSVLRQRQLDGMLDPFHIWDDINTFDGRPWRGHIDVVSGGFPCQDISSAGRGAGLDGARSGLWFEMLRVIGEVEPAFVFAENSPNLRTRGLDRVIKGLAELGFECAWGVLGAWHVGAPHRRNRMWIVAAHPDRCREREQSEHAEVGGAQEPGAADVTQPEAQRRGQGRARGSAASCARESEQAFPVRRPGAATDTNGDSLQEQPGRGDGADGQETPLAGGADWWSVHRFTGVDDVVASRMERVRVTGNGQVPAVAALAWRVLSETLK